MQKIFRVFGRDQRTIEAEERKRFVEDLIDTHRVVLFGKTWCPYTAKAKGLFDELRVEYHEEMLDKRDDMSEMQDTLHEMSGIRTVPNIWVNRTHVGGSDALIKAHMDGKLAELLAKA